MVHGCLVLFKKIRGEVVSTGNQEGCHCFSRTKRILKGSKLLLSGHKVLNGVYCTLSTSEVGKGFGRSQND